MTDLFVIGHPRCGTTSLHYYLSQHPKIVTSSIKEIRYFDINYHKDLEWYRSHFKERLLTGQERKFYVDCNPNYSFVNFTAKRIAETYPNAKILQIVRKPSDRVYSWWNLFNNMRQGREPRSFEQFIMEDINTYDTSRFEFEGNYIPYLDHYGGCYKPFILESGAYFTTYKRYAELFDDVKVIDFNSIKVNPKKLIKDIIKWIGLDYFDLDVEKINIEDSWNQKNKRNIINKYKLDWSSEIIDKFFYKEVYDLSEETKIDFINLWNLKK